MVSLTTDSPQRNATVTTPAWPSVSEFVLRVRLGVTVFCILAQSRVTLGVTAKEEAQERCVDRKDLRRCVGHCQVWRTLNSLSHSDALPRSWPWQSIRSAVCYRKIRGSVNREAMTRLCVAPGLVALEPSPVSPVIWRLTGKGDGWQLQRHTAVINGSQIATQSVCQHHPSPVTRNTEIIRHHVCLSQTHLPTTSYNSQELGQN